MPYKTKISCFIEFQDLEEIRLLKEWYERLFKVQIKMSPFLARIIKMGLPKMREYLESYERKGE